MDKLPYREFIAMMQERTREADVPYSGSFELTPLCNLDCKMCYVHLQDPSVRHRMLSGEQWLSIGSLPALCRRARSSLPFSP